MPDDAGYARERLDDLRRRVEQLSALQALSKDAAEAEDLQDLLGRVLRVCMRVVGCRSGSVFLHREAGDGDEGGRDGGELELVAAEGPRASRHLGRRVKLGDGISGRVARDRLPLLVKDLSSHPELREQRKDPSADASSFICVPMISHERLTGVLNLSGKASGRPFDEADKTFLMTLANHASVSIERMQLYERVRRFNEQLRRQVRRATAELEQRNAELYALKEYNASIVSSIAESIVVVDRDLVVRTWNRGMAERFGTSEEEAVGKDLAALLPPWLLDGVAGMLAECLEDGRAVEMDEAEFTDASGEQRVLRIGCSPLRDADDRITGAVLILHDITQQVQLRRQLTISERLAFIGTLVAGVAHELNNPLDGAIRYANLALDKIPADSPVHDYLSRAQEGLSRMAKIIRSLLEFSNQTVREQEPTDINDAIEDAIMLLNHQAEAKGVQIVANLDPSIPIIMDGELYQVFSNLIKNALDATESGGKITITSRMSGSYMEIEFADTGCGIPPEIRDRIFDPFFTTKEIGKGTGLGLTICYGIVEKYRGTISVSSEVGAGSRFLIRLPVSDTRR